VPSDAGLRPPSMGKMKLCYSMMAPICLFLAVALIVLPLIVYALSALFASMLWSIECADATAAAEAGEESTLPASLDHMCSFYEWFKYVAGNLVGVSLSDVGPESGNTAAEVVDLVVSTWSLVLTGMVVGLIGGLSVISTLTDSLNEGIDKIGKVAGQAEREQLLKDIAEGKQVDLAGFMEHARGISGQEDMSDAQLQAEFARIDSDGNGYLDKEELVVYIEEKKIQDPIVSLQKAVAEIAMSQKSLESSQTRILEQLAKLAG